VEPPPRSTHGPEQLHSGENGPSQSSPVREHGDPGAVREQLARRRSQRREPPAAANEPEPEPVGDEPLSHIAAIEETELEQPQGTPVPDGESARVEQSHDPAFDPKIDDDADPHPNPDAVHPERPCSQEHQGRVISWRGPPRRRRDDMESRLRARREPEPPRAQAEPGRGAAGGPHAWLALQGARESRPRDVHEQRPAPRVAHGDRGGGRALQGHAQRTGAEPDAPAGRGTRDGCRGRSEDERYEGTPHLPITVNVSVAV